MIFDRLLAFSRAPQGGKVVTHTLPPVGLESRREAGARSFVKSEGPLLGPKKVGQNFATLPIYVNLFWSFIKYIFQRTTHQNSDSLQPGTLGV